MKTKLKVRWLLRKDMKDIVAIEQRVSADPWSAKEFSDRLRNHNCVGCVAEDVRGCIGFVIYEVHPTSLEILRMGVSQALQRTGVGKSLVKALKTKLERQAKLRNSLSIVVPESNVGAQLFLRHQGFRFEKSWRGCVESTQEDAYEFVFRPQSVQDPNSQCQTCERPGRICECIYGRK